MSHLFIRGPSVYSPIGVCLECNGENEKRVNHIEGFTLDAYCRTCCMKYFEWEYMHSNPNVPAIVIAQMSQMRQRHGPMRFMDQWRAYIVNPNGSREYEGTAKCD